MTINEIIDYCIWALREYIFENKILDYKILPLAKQFSQFPTELALTTTNLCNLKCIWCPNEGIKNKGVMPQSLFENIIDEFLNNNHTNNKRIMLGEFGEPLMDKEVIDRIEFIRKSAKEISLSLFTNAYALNKEVASRLIKNNVRVTISLDEVEPELFFKVKGRNFDVVFENTINFIDLATTNSYYHFEVQVKTLMSRDEINKSKKFQLLREKTKNIHLRFMQRTTMQNWAGAIDKERLFKNIGFHQRPPKRFIKEKLNVPCIRLFTTLQVNFNGKVHLCCKDMLGKIILGDLNTNNISEIWQGKRLEMIRKLAIDRKRDKIPLCNVCDFLKSWRYLRQKEM